MAKGGSKKGSETSGEEKARQAESSDLKEREYRDEQGNIHHHTQTSKEYQEKEKEKERK